MARADSYPGSLRKTGSGRWHWRVSIHGERIQKTLPTEDEDTAAWLARYIYNRKQLAADVVGAALQRDREHASTESNVYFIQEKLTQLVKIGRAKSPRRRLYSIASSSSQPVVLVGLIVGGGRDVESALHRLLAGSRVRGEWFAPTTVLCLLVEEYAHSEAGNSRPMFGGLRPLTDQLKEEGS